MRKLVAVASLVILCGVLSPARAEVSYTQVPFDGATWAAWRLSLTTPGEVGMTWTFTRSSTYSGLAGWILDADGLVVTNYGSVVTSGSVTAYTADKAVHVALPVWIGASNQISHTREVPAGEYDVVMMVAGDGDAYGGMTLTTPLGTDARWTTGDGAFARFQQDFSGAENTGARGTGYAAVTRHSQLSRTEAISGRLFGYITAGGAGTIGYTGPAGTGSGDTFHEFANTDPGTYGFTYGGGQGFIVGNEMGVALIGADVTLPA